MLPLILFVIAVVGIIGVLLNIDDIADYFVEDKKHDRNK